MDDDIKHVLNEIGIPRKSRLKIEEYGIHTLNELLQVKARLEKGELKELRDEVKRKLVKAAQWRVLHEDVNVMEEFDEDVFAEFCEASTDETEEGDDVENSDGDRMDQKMKHICNAISVPNNCRRKMEKYRILTTNDLATVEERALRRELNDLRTDVRKGLIIASRWIRRNPTVNVFDEFNESMFENLCKSEDCAEFAKGYIKYSLGSPYQEENLPHFNDVNADQALLEEVTRHSKEAIMASPNLREKCGNFDHGAFLNMSVRHFHKLVGQREYTQKRVVIAGRTQSGKSAVKGCIQSMCGMLKLPGVILTKGVDESIDLHCKMVDLAEGTEVQKKHVVVASSKKDRMWYKEKDILVREALEGVTHGGTLVVADTKAQLVNKACKNINFYREQVPGGLWVLVVDEADAMFRTSERKQVFEQALQQLMNKNPCMIIFISATAVPFMVKLVSRSECEGEDIEFINFEPQENYVSIENIKPLEVDGKKVYLEQNELSGKINYICDGITIGYANEKVIALYDDAVSNQQTRKGALVLDCSCPKVYVANNIKDKANAVQTLYQKRGIPIIVVTFSGSGIHIKLPPGLELTSASSISLRDEEKKMLVDAESNQITTINGWSFSLMSTEWQTWRNSLIGEVIECVDAVFGLNVPIFAFGYSKMRRGISFRSNRRVPTHMLMALGRGNNTATISQTLGRVTGNGKIVLEENGFGGCIRGLTTSNDLTLCIKMQNYINEISYRISQGDTFSQAMTGANTKIPDSANFLRHTFRELGRIKGLRKQFEEIVNIEDAPQELSPEEEETKDKYWENSEAQKLLRSLARLGKGHELVHLDDIDDDLEEAEEESYSMPRKTMRDLLRAFVDKALIQKDGKAAYRVPRGRVYWLLEFMNPEEGVVPDEVDLQSDDSDEECHNPDQDNLQPEDSIEGENTDSQLPRMVSNVSAGTEESPICIDCDDESVSSVSISAASRMERNISTATAAVVSPERLQGDMDSRPRSIFGNRVAKIFDSVLHFGTVVRYSNVDKFWSVDYDDGDDEQFDKGELDDALSLYKEFQANDPKKTRAAKRKASSVSESFVGEKLTNIDEIPSGDKRNKEQRKTCIIQPEKRRRVYYTGNDDTPLSVARTVGINVKKLILDNERRAGYKGMKRDWEFQLNSPIVLPLAKEEGE